jgi:hypothetical protein
MDTRDDDVINHSCGAECILSGSETRIWFRRSLAGLWASQKTRWQAKRECGREDSVKELDVKLGDSGT